MSAGHADSTHANCLGTDVRTAYLYPQYLGWLNPPWDLYEDAIANVRKQQCEHVIAVSPGNIAARLGLFDMAVDKVVRLPHSDTLFVRPAEPSTAPVVATIPDAVNDSDEDVPAKNERAKRRKPVAASAAAKPPTWKDTYILLISGNPGRVAAHRARFGRPEIVSFEELLQPQLGLQWACLLNGADGHPLTIPKRLVSSVVTPADRPQRVAVHQMAAVARTSQPQSQTPIPSYITVLDKLTCALRSCGRRAAPSGKFTHRCSGCLVAHYCSLDHQVADWSAEHSQVCVRDVDPNRKASRAERERVGLRISLPDGTYA